MKKNNRENINGLYQGFYRLLKPRGTLVTSFLTPSPHTDPNSEWDMHAIDEGNLLQARILFGDVLRVKWQNYSSSIKMETALAEIGFRDIEIIYDRVRIFPAVLARKGTT